MFKNETARDIVVFVELNPDRYVLPAGKKMLVEYDRTGKDELDLEIVLELDRDGHLQLRIYPEDSDGHVITIDGRVVEPWEGYVPSTPGNS